MTSTLKKIHDHSQEWTNFRRQTSGLSLDGRTIKSKILHANREKPLSTLPSMLHLFWLSTEQVVTGMMLLLFLFRFGHIKIPPCCGSLPLCVTPVFLQLTPSLSCLPPSSSFPLLFSRSHVVLCLCGLCGENFQTSGSFKSTKPPVWWLGSKTAWPQGTWAGSASSRQAEGLLRRWNTGRMSRPVFQDPPQRLLKPVS